MSKDLIVIDREVVVPSEWDYNTSVIKCKNLFKEVREKGADVLIELRIAHELLTEDSKKKIGRRYPDKTFEIYCKDIGITDQTARNWLGKYFPEYKLQLGIPKILGIPPLLPTGKFNIIYADPPWQYEFSQSESRSIEAHYDNLSVEEICNYKDENGTPVQDKFAEDAVLFLWATQPKIREALQVIEAWGFDYKTGAVWVKDKFGMGYYFREQHELLFVAKKGDIPTPSPEDRPTSIIEAPRLRHSSKPEIVYELIEKMYPGGTYLELFARSKRPNWAGWGKEYGQI